MTRTDFQQLAEVRLREAEALLAAGLWDGAYYLAGYAVECGLKACIMLHIERTGVIFQDRKFADRCWTHDLDALVGLAGFNPIGTGRRPPTRRSSGSGRRSQSGTRRAATGGRTRPPPGDSSRRSWTPPREY